MWKRIRHFTNGIPYNNVIVSPKAGEVHFGDLVEGVTYREEIDETTSIAGLVVIEHRDRTLSPHIKVVDENGEELGHYIIPLGALTGGARWRSSSRWRYPG